MEKRGRGPRGLGQALEKATREIFGERGFAEAGILRDWPRIVGAHMAEHSCPEKVSYGGTLGEATLHVRVDGGFATELQHLEPVVLDRINTYFGYRAIGRLSMVQGPLPKPAAKAPAEPARAAGPALRIEARDEGLRAALRDLDRARREERRKD